MTFSYPRQLAEFVLERWRAKAPARQSNTFTELVDANPLPDISIIDNLLATCYQASLLREETRQIRFRLMLRAPEAFDKSDGPPAGLHCLEFTNYREFSLDELRRLAPAADYNRTIIGVTLVDSVPKIWGLLQTGPRWLRDIQGGRLLSEPLPPSLVICARGAGHLEVNMGSLTIGKLNRGALVERSADIFASEWFPASFSETRREVNDTHFDRMAHLIGRDLLKRLVTNMSNLRHGGTLLIVPPNLSETLSHTNALVSTKFVFKDEEPRGRMRTLTLRALKKTAELNGGLNSENTGQLAWEIDRYQGDSAIAEIEESVLEMSYLISGLASVDGAVLINQRFDVLGFGCEIIGEFPQVERVARALDIEGHQREMEPTSAFGMRHRSAFRVCRDIPGTIAIVVSQDGNVRFVTFVDGEVTYWNHTIL